MSSDKSKPNDRKGNLKNQPQDNRLSQVSKKGQTLGAQHSAHGDSSHTNNKPQGKKSK